MHSSSADAAVGALEATRTPPTEEHPRSEYLLFTCRGMACAAPLDELREVLRAVPPSVRLPFSPAWLLGIFTLRTDLLGLVDPAPMLLGAGWAGRAPEMPGPRATPQATLIVGFEQPLLGLAVEAIGEIRAIRPDEIAASPLPDDGATALSYVRGHYRPDGSPDTYAVVDLAPFVAALLRALREGADHA